MLSNVLKINNHASGLKKRTACREDGSKHFGSDELLVRGNLGLQKTLLKPIEMPPAGTFIYSKEVFFKIC
jgi:hypothetical protein